MAGRELHRGRGEAVLRKSLTSVSCRAAGCLTRLPGAAIRLPLTRTGKRDPNRTESPPRNGSQPSP